MLNIIKENQNLKMKNTELKEDRDFVHAVMDKRMNEAVEEFYQTKRATMNYSRLFVCSRFFTIFNTKFFYH